MIRIEGIPIVAARLAAALKSAKVADTAPVRRPRRRLVHASPTAVRGGRLQGREPIRA
jgi:hypothetical protein